MNVHSEVGNRIAYLEDALTAANERIKAVQQENIQLKLAALKATAKLTAERKVSDKLEKALHILSKYFTSGNCVPVDQATIKTKDFRSITGVALAEVAAARIEQ